MPIDVEKLAREAGGTKERDEVFGPHYVMGVDALQRFAALVLEAAAVQCDGVYYQHIGPQFGEVRYGIAECAKAIRAMNPGESHG
jgi:hypothetical protein